MLKILAIFIFVPNLTFAGAAEDIAAANNYSQGPYDYFCTGSDGARHELGEVVCLINNSCTQTWLAKCDMSLNNPMWRKVQDGCPSAGLLHRFNMLQPILNTSPVGPTIRQAKT